MANINYEALKEQLLAQGIALPELNFCVVNESNQNSQDSTRENFGTETTPPVAMTECQVRNEESFEFGQSLEGELIELMKDYRCVWDVSCRAFKENQKKQQAWKEIAMKLNKDENMLKKTWKNLRDNLSKCLKKRELLSRSGAGATELPQCKFFKELQFLKDVLSNRSTHSSLSTPQLSVDNFDRFEYIEDTSTSKKPDVMYSTPKPMQSGTETPPAKRKRASGTKEGKATSKDEQSSTSSLDSAISEYLANQNDEKKNADSLFCQSLVPILSSLPARKKRIAKFEIQKLLYDIEFSDD